MKLVLATLLLAAGSIFASAESPAQNGNVPYEQWIAEGFSGIDIMQAPAADPIGTMRKEFTDLLKSTRDKAAILNWARGKLVQQEKEVQLMKQIRDIAAASKGAKIKYFSRDTTYADELFRFLIATIRENNDWTEQDCGTVRQLAKLFEPHVQLHTTNFVCEQVIKTFEERDVPPKERLPLLSRFWLRAKEEEKKSE